MYDATQSVVNIENAYERIYLGGIVPIILDDDLVLLWYL